VKRDTKKIGAVSELMVMAALAKSGFRLLVPYGDSARYDVVIENEQGEFARVQIKTGRLRKGSVVFRGYGTHTHRGGVGARGYAGEVEFFGVYCPEIDQSFLIPAKDVLTEGSLRVLPTRNNQGRKIRWAKLYALTAEKFGGAIGPPPAGGVA
jgi:hypothetical protein